MLVTEEQREREGQHLLTGLLGFVLIRITLRVRKLLLLIPTDPEVQDALDNFVPKESSVWSHQVRLRSVGFCL